MSRVCCVSRLSIGMLSWYYQLAHDITCAVVPVGSQRLQEMRQATAERTRGERDRKERKRAEKEWAKLNAQCAPAPAVTTAQPRV